MSRSSSIFRGFAKTKRHAPMIRNLVRHYDEEEKQSRSSRRPASSGDSVPEAEQVSIELSETEWED